MVAPVVIVQDLTKGPYQSGVTPAAGTVDLLLNGINNGAMAIILNDKLGSVTQVLGNQFDGRSFSVTNLEIQSSPLDPAVTEVLEALQLSVAPRANVFAGVPTSSDQLTSIQENDGSLLVPVEMFAFSTGLSPGSIFWRGLLGDNTNTLGSRRTFDPQPELTIGPKDAIIFRHGILPLTTGQRIIISVRGFYQQQPS